MISMSMRHMTMIQRAIWQYYTSDATNDLLAGNSYVIFAEPILPGYASITEQINSIGFTNTNTELILNYPVERDGSHVIMAPLANQRFDLALATRRNINSRQVSNISDMELIQVVLFSGSLGSPINGAIWLIEKFTVEVSLEDAQRQFLIAVEISNKNMIILGIILQTVSNGKAPSVIEGFWSVLSWHWEKDNHIRSIYRLFALRQLFMSSV